MSDELFSVADQVVLVSGGSRGIGRELARGFAERGATVVISSRDAESLREAADDISNGSGNSNGSVHTAVCDVANLDDIKRVVETVVADHGRIDTLLNVAGVNQRQRAEAFTADEFDFILDINLKGAYFMAIEVGKGMLERGAGCQIHVDSLNTYSPLKGVIPYAMSKGGLQMMTRGLALEWGPRGVRVNGLAPGFILTDLTRKLWSQPHMQEWGVRNAPLERLGEVEDLVGTSIFLASKASAFMTGQTLYVDGGMSAGTNWPINL